MSPGPIHCWSQVQRLGLVILPTLVQEPAHGSSWRLPTLQLYRFSTTINVVPYSPINKSLAATYISSSVVFPYLPVGSPELYVEYRVLRRIE